MDFKERILRAYPDSFVREGTKRMPMPYYMAYPDTYINTGDNLSLKDLEYLQQTYPAQVKKYQRRIAEILDKIDYDGSMIYDEYPDKASLLRLTDSIVKIMQGDANTKECTQEGGEDNQTAGDAAMAAEDARAFVQVLLCDEIYKRRHGRKKVSFIKF
jgi:hypothetical protein